MGTAIDLTGRRVERLTVVRLSDERTRRRERKWVCRCDCGSEVVVRGSNLREGHARSCGCLSRDRSRKHGQYVNRKEAPTLTSFRHMQRRCYDTTNPKYKTYGGRGIVVCERWRGADGFLNFLADMGERPEGKTLDRIDVNGNYEPANCRWATVLEQARNRQYKGPTQAEIAAALGISRTTLWRRKKKGLAPMSLTAEVPASDRKHGR